MLDLDLKEILKKNDIDEIVDSIQIEKRYFDKNPSEIKYFNFIIDLAQLSQNRLSFLEEQAFFNASMNNEEHILERLLEHYRDVLIGELFALMNIKRIESILSLKEAVEFAYKEQQRRQVIFQQL